MRSYLVGLTLAAALATSCNDETILPAEQPVLPDTLMSQTSAPADSTHQSATGSSEDSTTAPTTSYPDSAFYRSGKFQKMPYRIMLPRNYDPSKQYPLFIFLHGMGERGTDNERQLIFGANLFKSDSISKKYPAIVVFPQCPTGSFWVNNDVQVVLKGLIDDVIRTHGVDQRRIYIAGLSMGAYGTYETVANNPGMFAAAIPISGDGDVNRVSKMSATAWSIYGGGKDEVVPGGLSQKMADALRKAGASVRVKIYPQADHAGSWVNAFKEPDFCSWLFSKKKS
jgi:predicted peptidase